MTPPTPAALPNTLTKPLPNPFLNSHPAPLPTPFPQGWLDLSLPFPRAVGDGSCAGGFCSPPGVKGRRKGDDDGGSGRGLSLASLKRERKAHRRPPTHPYTYTSLQAGRRGGAGALAAPLSWDPLSWDPRAHATAPT